MTRLALVLGGLGLCAAVPAPVTAQDVAMSKFRVQVADGERLQGYVRSRSAHEIVLVTADGREHRVPLSEVSRMEVRRRNGNHLLRGAVVGAFIAGSLIATGAIDAIEDRGKTSGAAGALFGGATLGGALVGATVPRYGWTATDPRAAADRGLGLAVTVRF